MWRRIWVPEWLYRWQPRAALAGGGLGVLGSGESFLVLIVAMAIMAYGFAVLVARRSYEEAGHV